MSLKTRIGVIGCGTISDIYFQTCQTFEILEVVACADINLAQAQVKAEKYGIRACSVQELLADPSIEIVINLTVPKAHAEVAIMSLEAGKSIYSEKPLALQRSDAQTMLQLARQKNLLIGNAPDTFLGAGIQTCRELIENGAIGMPVGGNAAMLTRGPENWHPNPDFFYQQGGGPMFDMGPYYLTALITLLGPIQRISGTARITQTERIIQAGARAGESIPVEIPTHIAGVIDFIDGAVVTLTTSFDVWASNIPHIEIYGTTGSLRVPDPNTFGGPIFLKQAGDTEWKEIPITRNYDSNSRGLGVADLAYSLRQKRVPRASGDLAFHVLDAMHAFHEASQTGHYVNLTSTCERPTPLPTNFPASEQDA